MNEKKYIKSYLSDLKKILDKLDLDEIQTIYNMISEVRKKEAMVYVMGNGGSAASSSHMVCDMGKNTRNEQDPRLKIQDLNSNIPIFSAYANDEGYENVFKEQIITLGKEGDLLIAISGSGNSENVLKAIQSAKEKGMQTMGISGFKGGKLKELVDFHCLIPSDDMEIIEDVHIIINHILTGLLRGNRYM